MNTPTRLLRDALLLATGASLWAQPVPHHFGGITTRPDGNVEVTLDGSVSGMFNLTGTISNQFMQMFDLYPIECSSDLLHWTPLSVLLRTNRDSNPLCFQENNASGLDHCFYRTPTNHLLTAFPKPTGRFAVGTVDRVMMDPVRTNLYRYSPAEELASHGYVVVAVDHPDCWATEFPGGRCLAGNHSGDVPGRLKDMTFLLDELGEINASDPLFQGRLDLDRIGVQGGSYGGMVVKTCNSDERVKCAFFWDAMNLQSLCPSGLQKPFLVALGESHYFYSEDLWLINQAVANAVFLQLRGAGHNTPCDIGWTAESPGGRGPTIAYNACELWFFDTYLKGETPPFPTNPEIYNVKRK